MKLSENDINRIKKEQEENTPIAHYTTMESLCGMLNGIITCGGEHRFKLWASNIFALNDPNELKYGYSVIRTWLAKIESSLNVLDQDRLSRIWSIANIPHKKHTHYNKLLEEYLYNNDRAPYILSFSRNIDDLAMFRMYAEEASGVSIIFSYGLINAECSLNEVCYDMNKEKCIFSPFDMLQTVYQLYLKNLHETPLDSDNDKLKLMLEHFVEYVWLIAPFIKRGDYEYEQEIRHAKNYKISDGILFRTNKNGNTIPYKEIEIPLKAIKKIIIGSCANFELSKYTIELLFKSKGITNPPLIVKSQKEYRIF